MNLRVIKKRLRDLELSHVTFKPKEDIFPFKLRTYQEEIRNKFDNNCKYFLLCLPRRSGKDLFSFWLMLTEAMKRSGVYYYLAPTLKMLKNVIWMSGAIIDGIVHRYIDIIPKELIRSINNAEMIVQFHNGSIIRFVGTENLDRLRGITATGIVISEAAFGKEEVFQILNPIIIQSGGWVLMNSTPNGRNWFWRLMQKVKDNKDWLVMHKGATELIDESGNRYITDEDIQKAIDDGMSKSLVSQEFHCLPILDESKVIYAEDMKDMKILNNAYIRGLPVHFAFDLGVLDNTSIVGFQLMQNGNPSVIWCYQNNNEPWEHYYNHIISSFRNKLIGKFVLPHDSAKRNASSVTLDTVSDDFRKFGAKVMQLKRPKSMDGFISLTKSYMAAMTIDASCVELIEALESYQKDDNNRPIHDKYSHYASAFGYMCQAMYTGLYVNTTMNKPIRYSI